MTEIVQKYLITPEKVLESAKRPEAVTAVEHIVILWCKNIERVLALSKLMRKDTDAMGPNAELAYWRNLHAKMCFIIQQLQQWQFVHVIQLLVLSKSKVLRVSRVSILHFFQLNSKLINFSLVSGLFSAGKTWTPAWLKTTTKVRTMYDTCTLCPNL